MLVPQVLLEFFAVVTSDSRVLQPLDAKKAWEQVAALRTGLPVLDPRQEALTISGQLIDEHTPVGGKVFDLFLAAQMRSHGIGTICTCNVTDFARVPGIDALIPEQILARYDTAADE
ncbi:MAG: PIN domain-containing protein [Chloroflexi bacterium]|nr:PIN domain-containing protein [Chloroflexota bacterium]